MTKTLLFVGAGLESVHGIRLAKARGLNVVASDLNPQAPGFQFADAALIASTYDIVGTIAAVRSHVEEHGPIHGVMSIGVDVPLTVATVAEAFDLKGIPLSAAALSADKLAMKERFKRDGIRIPWFSEISSVTELDRVVRQRRDTLVIKPVDSRGSRGVQRLMPNVDRGAAFSHAKAQSPTGRVMVESYLDGPQVSTESLILEGVAYTPGFSDRNYGYLERYSPFFIENGGELPSHLPTTTKSAVRSLIAEAAQSLGVSGGVLKGDVVVHDGQPYIIEVATRLSGGFFCTLEIPLNTGVDFVGAVISWSLGEEVDPSLLEPRFDRPVVQRYAFLPPGRIRAISDISLARSLPGVAEVIVYARPGDVVVAPTDTTARSAMAIASGATIREAETRALAALDALDIIVDSIDVAQRIRA